jgi:hypothetical protein
VTRLPALEKPLAFLLRFLAVSTLVSLLWTPLSEYYLAILLPVVNGLLDIGAPSLHLEQYAQVLVLVVRSLDGSVHHLRFSGYELLHLHAVAGVALFAATPGLSTSDKGWWIIVMLALFWVTQVWSLYVGTFTALAEYWTQLPESRRQALLQSGWPSGFAEGSSTGDFVFGWWNMWGGPALPLVLWTVATQGYLLSGREHAFVGNGDSTAVGDDSGG